MLPMEKEEVRDEGQQQWSHFRNRFPKLDRPSAFDSFCMRVQFILTLLQKTTAYFHKPASMIVYFHVIVNPTKTM